MKALFVTIPHSGEQVPDETPWLLGLPEELLMCDVDRYVDQLYRPILIDLHIPNVIWPWHRYVVDLNRLADDVDAGSVEGSSNPVGSFTTGLHWSRTTTGKTLMPKPMPEVLHEDLVKKYFLPFHKEVESLCAHLRHSGAKTIFHIDLHSMPSVGTQAHRDPGQRRAEIVISDFHGKSCSSEFKDLVVSAYEKQGFQVAYNWPYIGGRLTQQYGKPDQGHHAIQVELRRDLYMDEQSKKILPAAKELAPRLSEAVRYIYQSISEL